MEREEEKVETFETRPRTPHRKRRQGSWRFFASRLRLSLVGDRRRENGQVRHKQAPGNLSFGKGEVDNFASFARQARTLSHKKREVTTLLQVGLLPPSGDEKEELTFGGRRRREQRGVIERVVSFSTALDRPRPPELPFLSQRPSSLQSVRISLLPSCLSTLPHSPPPVIRPYRPFIDNKKLSSFHLPRADTRPTTPNFAPRKRTQSPLQPPLLPNPSPLTLHPPNPASLLDSTARKLFSSDSLPTTTCTRLATTRLDITSVRLLRPAQTSSLPPCHPAPTLPGPPHPRRHVPRRTLQPSGTATRRLQRPLLAT